MTKVKPHAESGERLAEPWMSLAASGYKPDERLFTFATTYNCLQYRRNVFEKNRVVFKFCQTQGVSQVASGLLAIEPAWVRSEPKM
jgi:hypothetical protein